MYKPFYVDVSVLLLELSSDSNSTWLFWKLNINNNHKTNISTLDPKSLSKAEIGKLARGYKELSQRGVIKRIKQKHYLINPTVVVPSFNYLSEVILHWNRICPEFKI